MYSVDLFTSKPNVSVQGRVIAGYSGDTVDVAEAERPTEINPSSNGFQPPETQEETEVAQVEV